MKPLGVSVAVAVVVALGLVAGVVGLTGASAALDPGPPTPAALAQIPTDLIKVYRSAAGSCPGLPWQILAAIGDVESRHAGGRADPATGQVVPPILGPALDGTAGLARIPDPSFPDGWAHALGPMQILPDSWRSWATLAPGRPAGVSPDPQNARDAIWTAARYLCAGHGSIGDLSAAILSYNHSPAYLAQVWATAMAYGMPSDGSVGRGDQTAPADPGPGRTFPGDPATVVAAALSQLGVPYAWGGDSAGVALDCSGLVHVAYRAAGISLPRTTFDQASYGISVATDRLVSGDLLFYRGGADPPENLGHVAIYLGNGYQIAAPHTGAVVNIQPVPYAAIQLARRILTPVP
jgi:cell wall-associated NlpC family hydrolase